MKQKLHIQERIILMELLPKEGNFVTLKMIRELREQLALNKDERESMGIKIEGDQVSWDPVKAQENLKEMDFDDLAVDIVKSQLKRLDESNKLEQKHFTIYQKFMEENNG